MTDPIDDGEGGRDDDFDWERDDEGPSTREQLARLREGLSRSEGASRRRGADQSSGAELPGSLDRAIARVGGLFDEETGGGTRGVRDPYADFGGRPSPERQEDDDYGRGGRDPYEAEVEEDRPRGRSARRQDRGQQDRGQQDRGQQDLSRQDLSRHDLGRNDRGREERGRRADPEYLEDDYAAEDDRGERRGAPDRRERRAARSRKAGFSYDDSLSEQRAPRRATRSRSAPAREELGDELYRAPSEEDAGFDYSDAGWDEPSPRSRRDSRGYEARAQRRDQEDLQEPVEESPRGRTSRPRSKPVEPSKSRKGRRAGGMDPEAAAAEAEVTRGRGSTAFGSLERMLAGRYLRARRKEGFISVIAMLSLIGITLAVAVLIVVMSVMNGFRTELVSKFVGVGGHLTVLPYDRNEDNFSVMARKIQALPGVSRAAPTIKGQAFATSRYGGLGVLVRGLSKADLLSVEKISISPERSSGSLANFGSGDGIAIGEGLANALGVGVGDTLNVISPQGSVTPFGVAPKRRVFEVIYVFKVGHSLYDRTHVYMPLKAAQSFFNRPGAADVIDVQLATPDKLDRIVSEVHETVDGDFTLTTWKDENKSIIGALKTEQSVMFLILSLLILIASLIIISGLIMLVQEKGQDIAILRTMGLTRGGVMRVFFMCGATIGLIGVIVGVTLGVLVALNISDIKEFIEGSFNVTLFPADVYLFSKLPSRLDWSDVGFTVLITLGLSFVATLYPAWRAASMDPVEALRYE